MLLVVLVAGAVLLTTGSGGDEEPSVAGAPSSGAAPGGHVQGLGVAPPGDGVLVATHNGLYRAAAAGRAAVSHSEP